MLLRLAWRVAVTLVRLFGWFLFRLVQVNVLAGRVEVEPYSHNLPYHHDIVVFVAMLDESESLC